MKKKRGRYAYEEVSVTLASVESGIGYSGGVGIEQNVTADHGQENGNLRGSQWTLLRLRLQRNGSGVHIQTVRHL